MLPSKVSVTFSAESMEKVLLGFSKWMNPTRKKNKDVCP